MHKCVMDVDHGSMKQAARRIPNYTEDVQELDL